MRKQRARNWFVLSFFIAGILVPLGIMIDAWLTKVPSVGESADGHGRTAHWVFFEIIWPTWIFLFDAEHPLDITFALVFGAVVNGLWYAGVGFVFWYVGVGLKWLSKTLVGDS